ncbi:MAG: hypothetical protein IPK81_13915 [Rhodospirillales bacterium]|nr:MAG: hypothetical protein IPK81_13915 [Rhodospirillales bacterium]
MATRPSYIPAPPKDKQVFALVKWRIIDALITADLPDKTKVIGMLIITAIGRRDGFAYMSVDKIAEKVHAHRSRVAPSLKTLVNDGYIERHVGRSGAASEYWLDWSKWKPPGASPVHLGEIPF